MAWIRKSDGTRVELPDEDVWGTLEERAAQEAKERHNQARLECQRRIFEVVDQHAQMNMAAAAAAGLLTDDQMDAWRAGLHWVGQMRANWQLLAAGKDDIYADASWPDCPSAAKTLADAF